MKRKTIKIVCLIIAGIMILGALLPIVANTVFADTIKDKIDDGKDLIDEKNNQRDDIQSEIDGVNNEKNVLLKEKRKIDSQINTMEDKIADLESQITQKQADIDKKETEIVDLSAEIEKNDESFKKRVRVMYEKGDASYLEVVLGSESFSDLFTRMELVSQMAVHDKKLIASLNEDKAKLETVKTDLQKHKKDKQTAVANANSEKLSMEKKSEEREALINDLEKKEDDLRAVEEAIDKEMEEARLEIIQLQKELEEQQRKAEEERKRREEEAKKNGTSGGSSSKVPSYEGGPLGWPSDATTRVTSEFGMRYHPTLHYTKLHTGMDVGASYGTNILAAEDGTVIKAAYSNAYGNHVIISHGNGLTTLYAHASKLSVSKGDSVERGQVIAKVGSTGYSTGAHIHFEVIINGSYQNPRNYFK